MFTYKRLDQTKERYITAAISSLLFFLAAHGYRMSNTMFSHDSLLEILQDDSAWQIALGRFMHPILIFLRGGIGSPWLIGCLALLWLTLSTCLLTELFDLRDPLSVFLTSGIVICNPTIISCNAAFLQWVDFYSFALLLSILGVFLCRQKGIFWKIMGILSMAVSMGTYQSYICVSILLFMLCILLGMSEDHKLAPLSGLLHDWSLFKKLSAGKAKKTAAKKVSGNIFLADVWMGVTYCIYLLLSAGIYFFVWKLFQRIFGIWTADTYNGMASVGSFDSTNMMSLFTGAYTSVFHFFVHPEVFVTMVFRNISLSFIWVILLRVANAFLLLKFLWDLFQIKREAKASLPTILMDLLLICLLPFGMNLVYVLSKGMEHTLMIFAFSMFYFLVIVCSEKKPARQTGISTKRLALLLPIALVIWCNIVYGNQAYMKKELQEKAAASLLTRIVTQMEEADDYIPGVTPVAFSGYFSNSPYLRSLPGFEEITPYGMGETALTYMGTDYAFLKYELNIPINETRVYADDPRVAAMPVYPAKGSMAYVDGVFVVKISE